MRASPKSKTQIENNSVEPHVNAGRGIEPRPDRRRGLTIVDAKAALPLPQLMDRLGLGAHAEKSARCPFHDDGNNSFSVWQSDGTWFFKCHAGCGEGDEINFLEKHKGVSRRDAIKLYLELAGGRLRPGAVTPRTRTRPDSAPAHFDWHQCVQNLTPEARKKIADKRGYSLPFVDWLHENKLIGNFARHVAFPVQDNGEVLGVHYKSGDGWRYAPVGTKTRPFIIGELIAGDPVHVSESQWDAFAYMDKSGQFPVRQYHHHAGRK
jgi:CHC2-type zinc finger protein